MKITRTSMATKQIHTRELDVTPQQMDRYYGNQGLIQDIFPNLSAEDREFIKSGITPEEWAVIFPPEEED